MGKLLKSPPKIEPWSLKKFFERKNHILINRSSGGLGDILMHRMIFEDFKILCPEVKITFACPSIFHPALLYHPFVDHVVDKVDHNDFLNIYDTSHICGATETKNAPLSSPHRADIWAESCGIKLTKHEMYLKITDAEKEEAKKNIEEIRDRSGPIVAFAPFSAIYSKNLDATQWKVVIDEVRNMGCFIFGVHSYKLKEFDAPCISGKDIRNFMALIDAADYVITTDSAAFHIAGGLSKPQVGIFAWSDGKVYGKHYKNWELVQKHRDNGNWDCGPCYTWGICPKSKERRKPCMTQITGEDIVKAFGKLRNKFSK